MTIECGHCGTEFEAKTKRARYCSTTCRSRAARDRKAKAAEVEAEKDAGSEKEHSLVKAVRRDLARAEAVDTVAGQLALQVARRIANPEESSISALSKELRSLLAEAKSATPAAQPEAAAGPVEEDDVTRARRRREEIAAQAAAAEAQA